MLVNFFHRLFNPHCEHCIEEARELKHCDSCDILKMQLALKTDECNKLMDRLLNPPTQEPVNEPLVNVTRPNPTRYTTWAVRKQMLEQEDKKKAELLRQAPKPSSSVEELEKELGVQEG